MQRSVVGAHGYNFLPCPALATFRCELIFSRLSIPFARDFVSADIYAAIANLPVQQPSHLKAHMTKQSAKPTLSREAVRALLDTDVKAPEASTSMADVREGIDAIDRLLGALIAERQRYVERAGHIKPGRDAVRDEPRVEDVVAKAKAALVANGGHGDLADAVWRPMIEWFIAHEFDVYDDAHADTDD